MNLNSFKMIVLTCFGAVGSFIINVLLGGWTEDLATLLILMGIDFVMGLMLAAVWKKSGKSETGALNSKSAWKGLCRKGCSLLVVMVAHRLDVTLGISYVKTAVIIGFIANEGISIAENYGMMGGWLPKVFKQALEVLQAKSNNAGEKEENTDDWN